VANSYASEIEKISILASSTLPGEALAEWLEARANWII
jgi:hypothetical protein